ncbi:MAG TPA: tRNA (adenosine(37)-N6)-threonylcarbamoyltransferase complex dimerization subunit type 1 TsaB [Azospirillaceae bacterium]|nr:tRNA (adenosine(37)-N6)-threonylcarbamoyltransferase complex dimerization subunit type 1 TsaB [Azospirillaceae bacterium]
MRILAFDCAVTGATAAVLVDGRTAGAARADGPRGQAERLIPVIEAALAQAGLDYGDLDRLAVTVGPGSFTGIRVGLAAARGLVLATGLDCVPVTTFDAIAHAVPATLRAGRHVWVAIDSRRGDLFVQAFGADLAPIGPSRVATVAEVAADVANRPGDAVLAGDGASLLAASPGLGGVPVAPSSVPDAEVVARIAAGRSAAAVPPSPLYLRPPDVTLPPLPRPPG